MRRIQIHSTVHTGWPKVEGYANVFWDALWIIYGVTHDIYWESIEEE